MKIVHKNWHAVIHGLFQNAPGFASLDRNMQPKTVPFNGEERVAISDATWKSQVRKLWGGAIDSNSFALLAVGPKGSGAALEHESYFLPKLQEDPDIAPLQSVLWADAAKGEQWKKGWEGILGKQQKANEDKDDGKNKNKQASLRVSREAIRRLTELVALDEFASKQFDFASRVIGLLNRVDNGANGSLGDNSEVSENYDDFGSDCLEIRLFGNTFFSLPATSINSACAFSWMIDVYSNRPAITTFTRQDELKSLISKNEVGDHGAANIGERPGITASLLYGTCSVSGAKLAGNGSNQEDIPAEMADFIEHICQTAPANTDNSRLHLGAPSAVLIELYPPDGICRVSTHIWAYSKHVDNPFEALARQAVRARQFHSSGSTIVGASMLDNPSVNGMTICESINDLMGVVRQTLGVQ